MVWYIFIVSHMYLYSDRILLKCLEIVFCMLWSKLKTLITETKYGEWFTLLTTSVENKLYMPLPNKVKWTFIDKITGILGCTIKLYFFDLLFAVNLSSHNVKHITQYTR